ncbi:acylneuraminate cytidylyltransferase family protein [Litchfieldia salsa]|uniref:N-acylneuraminate cytidylyltransferase/CMP-N,N'-diacetyllegionaminic acid synthase n=1 Tax=Litchfieldia salsa TaxID=930152 RepID=A0A1H0WDV8_9BACI|nr:acylneuraminate cytidylyltransferase family protein [Litchfieldia salsa]SDP88763.1 N-acylneuraminate cytidylyltransferase/CMP-N,N'-diacetyllegionaminic acid synthase [Litchfieldia salsa]
MSRRICSICARGGSKGVNQKNIRSLLGEPLIAHSIKQAKASGLFDAIAVSSDSDEILTIAKNYGVDFLVRRPDALATDKAPKLPVIQHCLESVEAEINQTFDIIVDLDATSPLRSVDDIVQSVRMFESNLEATNLISGVSSRRNPYFNLVEMSQDGYVGLSKQLNQAIIRRQDSPRCFDMNASIYIWKRDSLVNSSSVFQSKTILYEMPEERSIDVDSELDFEWVSFLAMKRGELL